MLTLKTPMISDHPPRRKNYEGEDFFRGLLVAVSIGSALYLCGYWAWSAFTFVRATDATVSRMVSGAGIE